MSSPSVGDRVAVRFPKYAEFAELSPDYFLGNVDKTKKGKFHVVFKDDDKHWITLKGKQMDPPQWKIVEAKEQGPVDQPPKKQNTKKTKKKQAKKKQAKKNQAKKKKTTEVLPAARACVAYSSRCLPPHTRAACTTGRRSGKKC